MECGVSDSTTVGKNSECLGYVEDGGLSMMESASPNPSQQRSYFRDEKNAGLLR